MTFDEPVTVYNLEVEDFHAYFVTDTDVLVHNAGYETNKESDAAAEKLGYEKTKQQSSGKRIYKRGKGAKGPNYISADRTTHTGGFWKGANKLKELFSKTSRAGTYDEFLKKTGD